jgi:hypothetical protein
LQLIIEKILENKMKIVNQLQPIVNLYGHPDNKLFVELMSLMNDDPHKMMLLLRVNRVAYSGIVSAENLASLAFVEGLKLNTLDFAHIESQYKFAILKRLLCNPKIKNKLVEAMVKAIPKKELRKP